MSKREIRADKVSIEGDFISLETKSARAAGAVVGAIVGTVLAPGAGTMLGGLLGAAASGGEVRLIPKSDVVEIKKGSSGVTVVVDEERGNRR